MLLSGPGQGEEKLKREAAKRHRRSRKTCLGMGDLRPSSFSADTHVDPTALGGGRTPDREDCVAGLFMDLSALDPPTAEAI